MNKLERLAEASSINRLEASLTNLDRTIITVGELLRDGAVPSSGQLKQLWEAHEKLGALYDQAEKARVQK